MNAVATAIGNCDGYSVATPAGVIGWVEELWLDDDETVTAVVVRLVDGRRGLLMSEQIGEVAHDRRTLAIGSDARILRLEPPHVHRTPDGAPVASWSASGAPLKLPEPPGLIRGAFAGLHRPAVPKTPGTGVSTLQTIVLMFTCIGLIGLSVIGLDILVAYLATGHPPY